jgi:hypothetical protein
MTQITASAEQNTAIKMTEVASQTRTDSVKDAGRVHIGGGFMRFDATKDAGRVHVGGGFMRF